MYTYRGRKRPSSLTITCHSSGMGLCLCCQQSCWLKCPTMPSRVLSTHSDRSTRASCTICTSGARPRPLSYLILGIIVPLWTGFNTEEIVTSNWICFDEPCVVSYSTYVECLFLLISNCCAVCRVFDVLVRYPVIVLPIAIALSSFPLEVITMSDNVKLMFSARSARAAIDEQVTWKERGFRCLFVIIPLIFALFLFDFNTAVSYTSLFGDYLTLRLRGM